MIISSIVVVLIILFLILFAIRTFITYRLSRRVSRFDLLDSLFSVSQSVFFREHELQLQNPCMATLTTGGMMGDGPLTSGTTFIRPIGHRIYVPIETSFVNATRFQANMDDDEKREMPPPPKYVTNLDDPVINITPN